MKVVHKFSKVVKFIFAAGSCACVVVNVSFVEVRLFSKIMLKDLLFDVADEKTSLLWSKPTRHCYTTRLWKQSLLKLKLLIVRTIRRTKVCDGGFCTGRLFTKFRRSKRPSLLSITVYSDLMSIVNRKRSGPVVGKRKHCSMSSMCLMSLT